MTILRVGHEVPSRVLRVKKNTPDTRVSKALSGWINRTYNDPKAQVFFKNMTKDEQRIAESATTILGQYRGLPVIKKLLDPLEVSADAEWELMKEALRLCKKVPRRNQAARRRRIYRIARSQPSAGTSVLSFA